MATEDIKSDLSPSLPPSIENNDKDNNSTSFDLPQQTDGTSSPRRINDKKKKNQTKKKKKPYKPAYLDAIQQEIDDLKQEARSTYEQQARQNAEGEIAENENELLEKRLATSATIDKLEALKLKLSTPEMLQRSSQENGIYSATIRQESAKQNSNMTTRFQQETLTLLHFFYIVRLAQQGFFTIISQSYPNIEPNALIHLCDKLVGGSLFVVKDPSEHVRQSKNNEVFHLLKQLHDGSTQPIDTGFSTTFEQIRHLIYDFIESTTTMTSPPSSHQKQQTLSEQKGNILDHTESQPSRLPLPTSLSTSSTQQQQQQQQQQQPVWLVVPFHGMINELPLMDSSTDQQSAQTTKIKPGISVQDSRKRDNKKTTTATDVRKGHGSGFDQNGISSSTAANLNILESQENGSTTQPLDQVDESISTTVKTIEVQSDIPVASTSPPTDTPLAIDTTKDVSTTDTVETTSSVSETTDATKDDNKENDINKTQVEMETSATGFTSNGDKNSNTNKVGEDTSSSGWGSVPTTISSYTTGKPDQENEQPEEDNGWGTRDLSTNEPPVWEGKLPDDLVGPGDETITGDVANSQWRTTDTFGGQRRMDGRGGRMSSYRGRGGSAPRGSGGYRPYGRGGDFRGGRGASHMRRGSSGHSGGASDWNKSRSPRSE
ncbi:uncharacterized protein BX664DRAFT_357470 [Halteromyces radiatus]|uniref:uncharacterized protein n=1 Tax=Halteromyces radiatus TaxID=101107 RepID=UPI00221EAE28|nr:uncharacterized protein BX664DRAFT_357470 [Halteromyces radiatus]KAI8092987.1 hypothetical protein BX664DRAFT_357470 [Halteromyces radiatus]